MFIILYLTWIIVNHLIQLLINIMGLMMVKIENSYIRPTYLLSQEIENYKRKNIFYFVKHSLLFISDTLRYKSIHLD